MSNNAHQKSAMSNLVLACQGLKKSYYQGKLEVPVLTGVDLEVHKGESVAIVGASGSGKSTLLHLLGGLDTPTDGAVQLLGRDPFRLSEEARCTLRNEALGFVYQFHHLLPEFTAAENVALVLTLNGVSHREAMEKARTLLERLGLGNRADTHPATLSGGEQQRVAVARAVVNDPVVILADEPTAALDTERGKAVMDLLRQLGHERQAAVIVVTHDERMIQGFDRVYHMTDGKITNS